MNEEVFDYPVEGPDFDAQTTAPKKKSNKVATCLMSFMALLFAYIVTKDVVLPSFVLYGGALVGGLVLAGLGLNKPQVITYVLVAYMPFSKVLVGDFGGLSMALNLTNLLMGFILVSWVSGKFADEEPLWTRAPLNVPIVLFMLLGLLAVCRGTYYDSGYLMNAVIEYKRWITPLLLYYLVLNTVRDRATIRNVVIVIMVVTTIVGLMAIYDYIELGDESDLEKARVGGICDHSNSLAAFFNYYMFLPLGFLLMNMNRPNFWLFAIPFLIMFRGIMVTFSRGGYVAFAFGLYAIVFIRNKFLFFLLIVATVLMILNPILLPAGIRYRMGHTFNKGASASSLVQDTENLSESVDASARIRLEIWTAGLEMIKDHPVWGVGYGLFHKMLPYYWPNGREMDAHNTYLIITAEMGIPALLSFLLIILMTLWHTWRLYATTQDPFAKATALGVLGGLFGLLMSNMFGSRLDSQEVSSYFWILAAVIMRLRLIDQKEARAGKPQTLGSQWSNQYEDTDPDPILN